MAIEAAPKTPNLEEVSILCPHVVVRDSHISLGSILHDGAMINLGDRHLLLCHACWEIVRARVYDSIVQLAVKAGK